MTIINRALHKAYKRRSDADPAAAIEPRLPPERGWAATLRPPIRPTQPADRIIAVPDSISIDPVEPNALNAAQLPVRRIVNSARGAPARSSVRIDTGHSAATRSAQTEATTTQVP